jgi:hypothetical protein
MTVNGITRYYKPKKKEGGYKPLKHNSNEFYFHDRQSSICKQIWDIGQRYYLRMQEPVGRPRHRVKNPAQVTKAFYWDYLTGARQQEMFLKPYPTLDIVNKDGGTYAIVEHVNQKHKPPRNSVVESIPIFDEWEQRMWNFITDGGAETEADSIFKYKSWNSTKKAHISNLFKRNFKTDLESPERKVFWDAGINPHILRHMRAYNILIEHKVPREYVITFFGWDSQYMLDHYADIRKMMNITNQEKYLRENKLLTGLRIDAGRVFTSV